MREILSTITSKGQVTIPKDGRQHLGLAKHDKVAFVVEEDGTAKLRVSQYPNVASLAGTAGSLGRRASWDEMRDSAREEHLKHKIPSQSCKSRATVRGDKP